VAVIREITLSFSGSQHELNLSYDFEGLMIAHDIQTEWFAELVASYDPRGEAPIPKVSDSGGTFGNIDRMCRDLEDDNV